MPATRKNLGTYNITRAVIFCKSALALDKVYQSGIIDFIEAEEDRGKRGPLPAHPDLPSANLLSPPIVALEIAFRSFSVLSASLWQIQSFISAAVQIPPGVHRPNIILVPCKSFRINTCKSVSKQATLTSFRINTSASELCEILEKQSNSRVYGQLRGAGIGTARTSLDTFGHENHVYW